MIFFLLLSFFLSFKKQNEMQQAAAMNIGNNAINDIYNAIKSTISSVRDSPYNIISIKKKDHPRYYAILLQEICRINDQTLSASHYVVNDMGKFEPTSGSFIIHGIKIKYDSDKEVIQLYNTAVDRNILKSGMSSKIKIPVTSDAVAKTEDLTYKQENWYSTISRYVWDYGLTVLGIGLILSGPFFIKMKAAQLVYYLLGVAGIGSYLTSEPYRYLSKCYQNYQQISKDKLNELRKYTSDIFSRYDSPNRSLIHKIISGDMWAYSKSDPYLDVERLPLTDTMKHVLEDVKDFYAMESEYRTNQIPFHKGYLLHGPGGSGKTSMANIIASIRKVEIYEVSLTDKDMTNQKLKRLMTTVTPGSVILFDEFDKQIIEMRKNIHSMVSFDSILSTICGSSSLPDGVLLIMTANSLEFCSQEEYATLTRPGRINEIYRLEEQFNNQISLKSNTR
jgi:hypothetical protein